MCMFTIDVMSAGPNGPVHPRGNVAASLNDDRSLPVKPYIREEPGTTHLIVIEGFY